MPGVEIRQRAASEGQRGGRRGQEGGGGRVVRRCHVSCVTGASN